MTDGFRHDLWHRCGARARAVVVCTTALVAAVLASGCTSTSVGSFLSPGFVDLIDADGALGLTTLDNSPGHVGIIFLNNTDVDERLLDHLDTLGGGDLFTEHERSQLRARVRFRIDVVFTNGNINSFEMVSGSSNLVDPRFNAPTEADLVGNNLDNILVMCDVAEIRLRPTSPIEVFVPVPVQEYVWVPPTDDVAGFFRLDGITQVTFRPMLLDVVDNFEDFNVTVRRNLDPRRYSDSVDDPRCGTVVVIEMKGTLSVPFRQGVAGPSVDIGDLDSAGSIGGRYEFTMRVLD